MKNCRIAAAAAAVVALGGIAGTVGLREPQPVAIALAATEARPGSAGHFARLPLHFEPAADANGFVARGKGYVLSLQNQGATLHLAQGDRHASLDLQLIGAQARTAQPEARLPGVSNYLLGSDPERWRLQSPHFGRVRYPDVYRGIDLVYYGSGSDLEYDFIVAPGADPSQIRLGYAGANAVRVDEGGNLRVGVDGGEVVHRKPVVYQQRANAARTLIEGAFRLVRSVDDAAQAIVSFDLGAYDKSLPLVIDPVLTYATYLGGTADNEQIAAMAVDAAGAIYVAGTTLSTDFPVTAGAFDTTKNGNGFDVFVAKLNAQGTALEYATYLGGSSSDEPFVLRVDAGGSVYVAGTTLSTDFPLSASAPQTTGGTLEDVFVSRLSATGGTLLYSTYLGGADGGEELAAFDIDAAGNAYVYGVTDATNFPTSPGAPQTTRGIPNPGPFDEDAFLTRINAAGNAFAFSTYHGGSAIDAPTDGGVYAASQLAIDDNGSAWIVGSTESADFPTTAGAFDTSFNGPAGGTPGAGDTFVARFDTVAGTRTFSTYLGGTGDELSEAIAVDGASSAYVAMRTASTNFPVTAGAFDGGYNGGGDIAVAKLAADGSTVTYATYVGGSGGEGATALRIDAAGAVFIAGSTQSANFPTNGGADTTHNGGGNDGFIAKLNPAGSGLVYATFAGSGDSDGVSLLEIDSAGSAYAVLGDTMGNATVTAGGRAYVGSTEDYFVKLSVDGSAFLDASYIGGGGDDGALAMAVDAQQNLYLAGVTTSTDYPTTAGVVQPAKAGAAAADDAFIVKFATTPDNAVPQPGTLAFSATSFDASESAGAASLSVSRSGGSSGAVSVTCTASTQPGTTATAGADYTATAVVLNWANGDNANKTCSVPLTDDTAIEGNETFQADLTNATGGAAIGGTAAVIVTITDDDSPSAQPGTVQFSAASYSGNENGGSVTLTLTRTNGADGAISVSVASGGGSAAAGTDYTALSQTVNWSDGDDAAQTVSLIVLDDAADEPDESVTVALAGATGGAALGAIATATVTIVDNDPTPQPPTPPASNGNAQGSYGGGAMQWYLLAGLGVLMLIGRRRTVLLVLLAATAGAQAAESDAGWYVGLRAGLADSTLDAADISAALNARGHDVTASIDDQQTTMSVFGGYRLANGFGVEMSYLDLGEYDITLAGNTTSPQTLLDDAQAVLADAGRGVGVALTWRLALTEQWAITPRLGGYYWESEREIAGVSGRLRREEDGIDLMGGVALSWAFSPSWALGVACDLYDAGDRNDIRAYTASVEYRFGR